MDSDLEKVIIGTVIAATIALTLPLYYAAVKEKMRLRIPGGVCIPPMESTMYSHNIPLWTDENKARLSTVDSYRTNLYSSKATMLHEI